MVFKKIIFLLVCISVFGCSEDTDISVARNLQEYMNENLNVEENAVFACAANAASNTSLTYDFYYPEVGASDIHVEPTEKFLLIRFRKD
jgi:type II secretory ATPase GspE/PulE/Tfp pilus assembly ATPase PilB-like protein